MPPRLSIIVAVSQNGVIGKDGEIPWHLSTDLQRFKRLTWDHSIIMGRRTFASLGRLLPHRRHIVLTRNVAFRPDGVDVVGSLTDALALTVQEDEVFVIGGADVYRLALPWADRAYLTRVQADVDGDTFFPLGELESWKLVTLEPVLAGERDDFDHAFEIWERREGHAVNAELP